MSKLKQIFIGKGKNELISTGGNSLCGLVFRNQMLAALPQNFTPKRSDAISDRDILSAKIGLLCNARNDFNDIDLYRNDEVIELYHAHGTSEQFHSELKTEMDVERLPSGKLCVNKIILLCAMAAYNVLRALGQAVIQRAALAPIKIKVSRWRLKTVLQNLVYCAGKLVRHAGRLELQFGKICPWYAVIRDIAASYA